MLIKIIITIMGVAVTIVVASTADKTLLSI